MIARLCMDCQFWIARLAGIPGMQELPGLQFRIAVRLPGVANMHDKVAGCMDCHYCNLGLQVPVLPVLPGKVARFELIARNCQELPGIAVLPWIAMVLPVCMVFCRIAMFACLDCRLPCLPGKRYQCCQACLFSMVLQRYHDYHGVAGLNGKTRLAWYQACKICQELQKS